MQYRRPRLNVWQPDVLIRDLMLYFASRDLHLSATFARRFYWRCACARAHVTAARRQGARAAAQRSRSKHPR